MRSIWLILVLCVFFITCCSQVTIEEPKKDSVHPDVPDEFVIKYRAKKAPRLTILLNGEDVTSLFTVDDGLLTASGATLASYTRTGTNIFEVTEPGSVVPVRFIIDRIGPVVQILNVDTSSGLQVGGYLQDDAGATSLSINGAAATLTEGSFYESVTEDAFSDTLSWVAFDAEDAYSQSSRTVFAHPLEPNKSTMLPNTLQASITDNGIQYLIDKVAEPYLASGDLSGGLAGTVIAGTSGSVGAANVTLNSVSFTTPSITTDPQFSTSYAILLTRVTMSLFKANITAKATLYLPWPIPDISISVSGTAILNNPDFGVTAKLLLANDEFIVEPSGDSLRVSSYYVDFSGVASVFEPLFALLEPLLNATLSDLLSDALANQLPKIVEPLWAKLPTDADVPVLGKTFNVDANPNALSSTDGTTISINLDTHIKTLDEANVPMALGSIYSETSLPTMGNTTQSGASFHAGAALPSSVLNQALLAAYYSGLTHITEAIPEGYLSSISGINLFIGPRDEVQFSVEPTSPAYVNLKDINGALLQACLERFSFILEVKKEREKEFSRLFSATLSVSAPLDVSVNNDTLDVSLDGIPETTIYNIEVLNKINISNTLIETIIDVVIPKAIPSLVVSLFSVPIPTFSGYSIALVERWLTTSGGNLLMIAGNLVVPSSVSAAVAKSVPMAIDIYVGEAQRSHDDYVDVLPVELGYSAAENQTRYRLDNGAWSVWRIRDGFNLYTVFNGDHELQICQRSIEDLIESCDTHVIFVN